MTWEELLNTYYHHWVELIDCDWQEEEMDPRSGVVRVHVPTRKEFDKIVCSLPPVDSAFVFVGVPNYADSRVVLQNRCS